MKYVIYILAPIRAYIFNLYLSNGVFAQKMQAAKVALLHIKGHKNDMGTYKSISIIHVFFKALENMMHDRLVNFIDSHALFPTSQFVFRKKCSREHALVA